MPRLLACLAGVVSAAVAVTAVARADVPPGPSDAAKKEGAERYDRGVKYYKEGLFDGALTEFQAAYRLTGRFEVLLNIGVTQRRMHRYSDAYLTLEKYLADGGTQIAAERREEVAREMAEIVAATAEVRIVVPGAPARIEVDDVFVGESPLPGPLRLASGTHELRATRGDELPAEARIEVISGRPVEITLSPKPRAKLPTTAKLTILSRPDGAALTVDGSARGKAPWSGILDAGGHQVRAVLEGFRDERSEVVLVGGQSRSVTLVLEALPKAKAPTRWYKRWYVWAGVGAVIAGGTTAFVLLNQPEKEYDVAIPFP